jgi:hypothetical protein
MVQNLNEIKKVGTLFEKRSSRDNFKKLEEKKSKQTNSAWNFNRIFFPDEDVIVEGKCSPSVNQV